MHEFESSSQIFHTSDFSYKTFPKKSYFTRLRKHVLSIKIVFEVSSNVSLHNIPYNTFT